MSALARGSAGGTVSAVRRLGAWWRRAARAAAVVGLVATVCGCGFALRGPPELHIQRIAFSGFAPSSPLARELRRQLAQSPGVQWVDAPTQAQVVLVALQDAKERSAAASTTSAQLRELQLRARFSFRVITPQGAELIPRTEILQSRDMSTSETFALAKAQEEEGLFRAMHADIAAQVMQRLAALEARP